MAYKAYLGPSGALVNLVGRLGGTTQITASHSTLISDSIDLRVADVEDALTAAGGYWGTSDPLYWTGSSDYNTALRFTGCSIPQGATITSATLTVYTNSGMLGATSADEVSVAAEDVDNATQLTSITDHNTRKLNTTTATVDWYVWQANGPLDGADQPVVSPDISAIVQEIVNRASWASGNAIQFFAQDKGTGQALAMRSFFNGASGTYPRLEVAFEYLA